MTRPLSDVRTLIFTDSILKHCYGGVGSETYARRGARVEDLTHLVASGQVSVDVYELIILHCGTNNIANGDNRGLMLHKFKQLIDAIKERSNATIVITSLLPRPVDHTHSSPVIYSLNSSLHRLSSQEGLNFQKLYKAFVNKGKPRENLFCRRDKLHLNRNGIDICNRSILRIRYMHLQGRL